MTYLQEMNDIGDDNLRARWCEDLTALPEWVISRQKKVQKRSCPDPNLETVSKKVKLDSNPPQGNETLEPVQVHVESQSKEEGDLVICMDKDDKEIEVAVNRSYKRLKTAQENMDEVRPLEKKIVSFKKKTKGSKKKKKGSSSRPLSYDEAIEAEVQRFSKDDFTLETRFTEKF